MDRKKVFIDGSSGTTGLKIRERLADRKDIGLITLPEERRHDLEARREAAAESDLTCGGCGDRGYHSKGYGGD